MFLTLPQRTAWFCSFCGKCWREHNGYPTSAKSWAFPSYAQLVKRKNGNWSNILLFWASPCSSWPVVLQEHLTVLPMALLDTSAKQSYQNACSYKELLQQLLWGFTLQDRLNGSMKQPTPYNQRMRIWQSIITKPIKWSNPHWYKYGHSTDSISSKHNDARLYRGDFMLHDHLVFLLCRSNLHFLCRQHKTLASTTKL